MDDLSIVGWVLVLLAAMIVGVSKAGVPGISIMAPVLLALAMPDAVTKAVGLGLPMLIAGDVFSLRYHRRHAEWQHLRRALPWAFGGIVLGFLLLLVLKRNDVDVSAFLKKAVGIIVLFVLAMSEWMRSRASQGIDMKAAHGLAPFLGLLGGTMTMLAHAAGPIFSCYLLALSLPKQKFMGSMVWLFFILNLVKVPFHVYLENITLETLTFDLYLLPAIAVGAFLGIRLFRIVPEKIFRIIVVILTTVSCIALLVR